jgi:hypothetical protein
MAPTATSVAALAGGIAFCVAITAAALLIFSKARATDLLGPVAVGCALRLGVMVAAHLGSLHTGDGGLMFFDDWGYMHRGALLAGPWREGNIVDPAAYQYAGTYQFGFEALVASVFILVGKSVLAVKLVNVLLSTATVLLVGLLAERILGEVSKRQAAWLAALMPDLVWWSAPMMKEALATFLVVAALLAAASLPKRSATLWLVPLLAALVLVRAVSALAVGAAIAVALGIAIARQRGRINWRRMAVGTASSLLCIAGLVLAVSKDTPGAVIEGYRTTFKGMIRAYGGSSIAGLPLDALRGLVTPFPWTFDAATRNWDRGLYPGTWLLYVVYPLAAYGCWRLRRRPELALLAVPIVVTLMLNASSAGVVFRQRSTLEPLIAVLAIAGLASWAQAARWAGLALLVVATAALLQSHSPLVFIAILGVSVGFVVVALRLRQRTLPSAWPDSRLEAAPSGDPRRDRRALQNGAATTPWPLLAADRSSRSSAPAVREAPARGPRRLRSRLFPGAQLRSSGRGRLAHAVAALLPKPPSSLVGEMLARSGPPTGDALRRSGPADSRVRYNSRVALTAAALLLLLFVALAVTTANERLAFERDVKRSFARTVETRERLARSDSGPPSCQKTATYRFTCTVPVRQSFATNTRLVRYRLTARDDGCWRAEGSTDQPHRLPQAMSACIRA